MKRIFLGFLIASALTAFVPCSSPAQDSVSPSGTYLYAQKDGQDLYMDVYEPSEGSETSIDGREKPTVLFMFGGGFISGRRDAVYYNEWFRRLNENGYRVVSIDYRLGLKGFKRKGLGLNFLKALKGALDMAVEDLFSATAFIADNAGSLGVDPGCIVVSGSSAGAMTAMQAEWEICNGGSLTAILPEGFNYAGVMSFAGAVFSTSGSIRYPNEPCPVMMAHGTDDKMVPYRKLGFLRYRFCGTDALTSIFRKGGFNYRTYRYPGHYHEIANNMLHNLPEEIEFLNVNVLRGERAVVDTTVVAPEIPIPEWARAKASVMY